MDETGVDFYFWFNPLVLVLCIDGIIFVGDFEQLMMWFGKIMACGVYLRDDGVWHVVDGLGLCSFKLTSGQPPNRGEVQDTKITSWVIEEPLGGIND
jgi:hypothetical protein